MFMVRASWDQSQFRTRLTDTIDENTQWWNICGIVLSAIDYNAREIK